MILTVKKFQINSDNDYEKMTSRVGQLRIFLEHILAGRVPNDDFSKDDLYKFCVSLMERQRAGEEGLEPGSWSVSPQPGEISLEDKMDYHFFPTFLALSLLVSCASKDSRIKSHPSYDEVLKKGFDFAISGNLEGYGFNSLFQQVETVLILGSGGCPLWLKNNPECCPAMVKRLVELGQDFQDRLDRNDTVLAFGGDYKPQFELAVRFLKPLSPV